MTAPVQSTSQVFTGVTTAVLALAGNATIGNVLVLTVSWLDAASTGSKTLTVPADANGTWIAAINPASSSNGTDAPAGAAIFYEQVASATTHSTTVSSPSGGVNGLYALVTLSEWPAATVDKVQSALNNSAISATSMNSGTTAALASTDDFAIACCALFAGTGLSNAGISTPATGYTASLGVSQASSTTVGAEASYLASTGSTAGQIANWTQTADATELSWQGAIATFTPTVTNGEVNLERVNRGMSRGMNRGM